MVLNGKHTHGRPAGFRTHLMVALGAALYMGVFLHFIRSMVAFRESGGRVDPGRVAAQNVVGIGFLGAGAINSREGLCTWPDNCGLASWLQPPSVRPVAPECC